MSLIVTVWVEGGIIMASDSRTTFVNAPTPAAPTTIPTPSVTPPTPTAPSATAHATPSAHPVAPATHPTASAPAAPTPTPPPSIGLSATPSPSVTLTPPVHPPVAPKPTITPHAPVAPAAAMPAATSAHVSHATAAPIAAATTRPTPSAVSPSAAPTPATVARPTPTTTPSTSMHYFDGVTKTFLCPNNCGISWCGCSSIGGKNMAGIVQQFIADNVTKNTTLESMLSMIETYFKAFNMPSLLLMHVVGYETVNEKIVPKVVRIGFIGAEVKKEIRNTQISGAVWDGESKVITKLMNEQYISKTPASRLSVSIGEAKTVIHDAFILDPTKTKVFPGLNIPWEFMGVQEAVDFARFAIQTTSYAMQFQAGTKTVGGPIDLLVIKRKSKETKFLSKKKLV